MSYIEKVLQPGETVRYRGKLSSIVYARPLLIAAAGLLILGYAAAQGSAAFMVVGIAGVLIGVALLVPPLVRRAATEITITDQRVVIKVGLIRTRTIEMNLDKIESVDVEQGILGRMFNFGDIFVHGTGAGIEPLRTISAPIEFRKSVMA